MINKKRLAKKPIFNKKLLKKFLRREWQKGTFCQLQKMQLLSCYTNKILSYINNNIVKVICKDKID